MGGVAEGAIGGEVWDLLIIIGHSREQDNACALIHPPPQRAICSSIHIPQDVNLCSAPTTLGTSTIIRTESSIKPLGNSWVQEGTLLGIEEPMNWIFVNLQISLYNFLSWITVLRQPTGQDFPRKK